MPTFGAASRAALATCHPDLIQVAEAAIRIYDFSVLQGHRSVADQQRLYKQGRTTPGSIVTNIDGVIRKGKHNFYPSRAFDLAPYPLDWSDHESFLVLGGIVMAVAFQLGVALRWGYDWDRDWNLVPRDPDESFTDLPHFEVIL